MASVSSVGGDSGAGKRLFTEKEAKIAVFISFLSFFLIGFQCAIPGLVSTDIGRAFGVDSANVVFLDSLGMVGQLLAAIIGAKFLSKLGGRKTLMFAALIMLASQLGIYFTSSLWSYAAMLFCTGFSIGTVLVGANYLIVGSVTKEGESEGKLSLLNLFFSIGFVIGPIIGAEVVKFVSWRAIFFVVSILFVILISLLVLLKISERIEEIKKETEKGEKETIWSLPINLKLMGVALFCIVYAEQITNYWVQPYLRDNIGVSVVTVGTLMATFAFSQAAGRLIFGSFVLSRVKTYKFIAINALVLGITFIVFANSHTIVLFYILMVVLGLSDSCMYPSILGYGMDQIKKVSPKAMSFLIAMGLMGGAFGLASLGVIGKAIGKQNAIFLGPIVVAGILTITLFVEFKKKRAQIIPEKIK